MFALSTLLKETTGRCPICQKLSPARVVEVGKLIYLERTCGVHGVSRSLLSSDSRFYWLSKGAAGNCCSGSACCAETGKVAGTLGKNASLAGQPFETLSTCLALIELVDTCNLTCPVCYADSPEAPHAAGSFHSVESLKARVQAIINRKGRIDILQLSGGEPTLHPDFFTFVDWAQQHESIDYVLLNTNGIRLLEDSFFEGLCSIWQRGKFQIYLQFDGVQIEGQKTLRGMDLRTARQDVIERCEAAGIPITLAMTVTPETIAGLWKTVEFGLAHSNIRGVSFQPFFQSGRKVLQSVRLNAADIILGLMEQSDGKIAAEDFTPLPCGDPNCSIIGYLIKTPAGLRSIREFVDFKQIQGFLQNRVRYSLADLAQCGCESEPLGALLKGLEIDERHAFRLFIKPFMDAESWDQDRIDRCCTHVIRKDGTLDSFCRYYSGFSDTKPVVV